MFTFLNDVPTKLLRFAEMKLLCDPTSKSARHCCHFPPASLTFTGTYAVESNTSEEENLQT
jgi:hypothetical protein